MPDRTVPLPGGHAAAVAVGAAIGDALGMPLEFGPPRPAGRLVRNMLPARLPAGTFTDDTEMALAPDRVEYTTQYRQKGER